MKNSIGHRFRVETLVWRGIAPPRVEYFGWLALQQRIATPQLGNSTFWCEHSLSLFCYRGDDSEPSFTAMLFCLEDLVIMSKSIVGLLYSLLYCGAFGDVEIICFLEILLAVGQRWSNYAKQWRRHGLLLL